MPNFKHKKHAAIYVSHRNVLRHTDNKTTISRSYQWQHHINSFRKVMIKCCPNHKCQHLNHYRSHLHLWPSIAMFQLIQLLNSWRHTNTERKHNSPVNSPALGACGVPGVSGMRAECMWSWEKCQVCCAERENMRVLAGWLDTTRADGH